MAEYVIQGFPRSLRSFDFANEIFEKIYMRAIATIELKNVFSKAPSHSIQDSFFHIDNLFSQITIN